LEEGGCVVVGGCGEDEEDDEEGVSCSAAITSEQG
jgi:hypothetical protein